MKEENDENEDDKKRNSCGNESARKQGQEKRG
jgi:hypothetical protein